MKDIGKACNGPRVLDVGPMFLSAAKNKVPNVVRDDNEN